MAAQRWNRLCFVHWRVDPALVAPLLPAGIRPDVFDGSSWVGLIPFVLDRARLLGGPPVPYFGRFVEVNVRFYGVDERGRRGVVFGTLEASRLLTVITARAGFSLPYRWARTRHEISEGVLRASSERIGGGPATRVAARLGAPLEPGPLEDFLTARWALWVSRGGRTRRLENSHEPWLLHSAELLDLDDDLVAACGLPGITDAPPDSVLFAPGVETRFGWWAIPDSN